MMNLAFNLPILITMSGGLLLFFYGYQIRMETAVILATISVNQPFMMENRR